MCIYIYIHVYIYIYIYMYIHVRACISWAASTSDRYSYIKPLDQIIWWLYWFRSPCFQYVHALRPVCARVYSHVSLLMTVCTSLRVFEHLLHLHYTCVIKRINSATAMLAVICEHVIRMQRNVLVSITCCDQPSLHRNHHTTQHIATQRNVNKI